MKKICMLLCLLIAGVSLIHAKKNRYKSWAEKPDWYWVQIPATTLKTAGGDSLKIASFYMFRTEVPNALYNLFTDELKQTDVLAWEKARRDTQVWHDEQLGIHSNAFVQYYHWHPAYAGYPVVGITYEAALLFCNWLEQYINKELRKHGKAFEGHKVKVTLPTEMQWVHAAKGGLQLSPYPWGGPYLRRANGDMQANFRLFGEGNITYDVLSGKPRLLPPDNALEMGFSTLFTAPVVSYWPNGYGLYNMGGNVSEMLLNSASSKGGSWFTYGADVAIEAPDPFRGDLQPRSFKGFRPVLTLE